MDLSYWEEKCYHLLPSFEEGLEDFRRHLTPLVVVVSEGCTEGGVVDRSERDAWAGLSFVSADVS